MSIPIKRTVERIPGGMMLVPLLIGIVIHTCAPNAGDFFGSFTGALFSGPLPILAVFNVGLGATIDFRSTPYVLRKGGSLLVTKVGLAVVVGLMAGHFMGEAPVSGGFFAGFSALAAVAAISDTNGGLYVALAGQFGKSRDVAANAVMSVESGPFVTMVILGTAGLSAFPWHTLLGAILPLLVGMLLGNLDPEIRRWFGTGMPILIPFFAFALGAGINLKTVWSAGLLGVLIGLCVALVGGTLLVLADRLTGGSGIAGLAAASTAGNAAAVPAVVAAANPAYPAAEPSATVLVSASVVVTAILVPILCALYSRHFSRADDAPALTGPQHRDPDADGKPLLSELPHAPADGPVDTPGADPVAAEGVRQR